MRTTITYKHSHVSCYVSREVTSQLTTQLAAYPALADVSVGSSVILRIFDHMGTAETEQFEGNRDTRDEI